MRWLRDGIACVGLAVGLVACAGCGRGESNRERSADAATQPAAASADDAPVTCRRKPVEGAESLTIAVIPMGSTHEFWKAIHAGAVKAELETPGVQVIWKGPTKEDDREQQINVVENFITAGVNGIALAPLDNTALLRPVREAVRAGIGVVIMDNELAGTVCEDFASFVATDSYLGGRKGGEHLGALLGGRGNVLLLRCGIAYVGTTRREQGFLDVMREKFPEIRLVSTDQYGGATVELAFNKAQNLLNRFQELDGIFCPNESTTFGMLRALQEAGLAGKVKFVGFDSSEKLAQAMRDGELHGLVLQDPLNIGYTAVKTLAAYLRGEPVPTRVDTGCVIATPANMDEPRIQALLAPPIDKYLRSP
jgi:ribose transport system substrate-binding protein